MGKLNFHGYLISQFFSTREIRENLMHAKNTGTCFTVVPQNFVEFHKLCCGIWQNLRRKNGGPVHQHTLDDLACIVFTFNISKLP